MKMWAVLLNALSTGTEISVTEFDDVQDKGRYYGVPGRRAYKNRIGDIYRWQNAKHDLYYCIWLTDESKIEEAKETLRLTAIKDITAQKDVIEQRLLHVCQS